MRSTNVQNASNQRCEHPGFPGASSVCSVQVPWTNPSPVRCTGVHCGAAKEPSGFRSWGPMKVMSMSMSVMSMECGGGEEGGGGRTRPPLCRPLPGTAAAATARPSPPHARWPPPPPPPKLSCKLSSARHVGHTRGG
eukprot:1194951-Prorocentrum_minimum.AAC.7